MLQKVNSQHSLDTDKTTRTLRMREGLRDGIHQLLPSKNANYVFEMPLMKGFLVLPFKVIC